MTKLDTLMLFVAHLVQCAKDFSTTVTGAKSSIHFNTSQFCFLKNSDAEKKNVHQTDNIIYHDSIFRFQFHLRILIEPHF